MHKKKTDKKNIEQETLSMVCKPLDSYSEILLFLDNPPPWRTLCKEMTPHSNRVIRNVDINKHYTFFDFETPEHFCHFDPDMEDPPRCDPKKLRKTLVCHDMANGYHDDSIIDGTENFEAYIFYNWAGIDIFCYFSHHLITIPPVGWINTGHAHGVRVIGTVITEWAEGITFWEQVLASETEYQNLANALVAIAKTLKFDGYLLNIENKVSKPESLLDFVRYFHMLLHQELKHATLIWYDSVTVQGNLNWQNGLNEKNKAFFDACDGFFTNYSWTVDDVISSAFLAGERVTDLYIGIDVWGRNFYGGGQFNTQEAVKVAYSAGCSLAMFAPAWTHESMASETDDNDQEHVAVADELDFYQQFLLRDRAFWGSVWPYLNTRLPCQLPFGTSFCRGQGRRRRQYGEVLCAAAWYNVRNQQYQPNAAHGPHGYILTTAAKLSRVSRHAVYKDKKGIIRYRPSFQLTRQDLRELSTDSLSPEPSAVSVLPVPDGPDSHSEDAQGPDKKKTTMKDAIINLFKPKSVKIQEDEPSIRTNVVESGELVSQKKSDTRSEREDTQPEPLSAVSETEAGPSRSTGRSMVQVSVNLRLGTSADKTRYCLAYVREELECLQLHLDDSYIGGACLQVNPSDAVSPSHRYTRLFHCDLECADTLVVCVVTKPLRQHAAQSLNVKLFMRNACGALLTVVLTARDVRPSAPLSGASVGIRHVYPLRTAEPDVLQALRTYLLLNEPGFYMPIDNQYGWTVRYYEVTVPGSRVTSINLRTGLPQGGILLGHLGICRKLEYSIASASSKLGVRTSPRVIFDLLLYEAQVWPHMENCCHLWPGAPRYQI